MRLKKIAISPFLCYTCTEKSPFIKRKGVFMANAEFTDKVKIVIKAGDGGAIHFSVKRYRKANILSFQKSIYAVKDHIEKNGQ